MNAGFAVLSSSAIAAKTHGFRVLNGAQLNRARAFEAQGVFIKQQILAGRIAPQKALRHRLAPQLRDVFGSLEPHRNRPYRGSDERSCGRVPKLETDSRACELRAIVRYRVNAIRRIVRAIPGKRDIPVVAEVTTQTRTRFAVGAIGCESAQLETLGLL